MARDQLSGVWHAGERQPAVGSYIRFGKWTCWKHKYRIAAPIADDSQRQWHMQEAWDGSKELTAFIVLGKD